MKKIILLFVFIYVHVLHAKDDDLFEDGVFEDMEVDRNFEDDFTNFANKEEPSAPIEANAAIIAPIHQRWDAREITRRESSVSILSGSSDIAHTYHLTIFPQARFEVWQIFGHVGYPFNFPVYDNIDQSGTAGIRQNGFVSAKTFIVPRRQDFTGWADVQRIVRHLEVGKPNDQYHLRFSRSHAITLGQGILVREMAPNGLNDRDNLFTKGHVALDRLRLDGFIGPTPLVEMLGINARFTPLATLNAPPFVQGINADLSYVGDFRAPTLAKTVDKAYVLDEDRRLLERSHGTAQAFSLGVASVYSPLNWLSLTPYLAYGHLFLTGLKTQDGALPLTNGVGFHFGHDAKLFFTPGPKGAALFLRTEGRFFSSKYAPNYFGSHYNIDRVVFNQPSSDLFGQESLSKSQYLGTKTDSAGRFGYELALAYVLGDIFNANVGYETAHDLSTAEQIPFLRKMFFRTNFFALDVLRLNLGYETSFIKEMKYLFDFDRTRALLSLGGQLQLMPNLYFDAWAKHSFGIKDMFSSATGATGSQWLANQGERRSLNFGLGLEFAMMF